MGITDIQNYIIKTISYTIFQQIHRFGKDIANTLNQKMTLFS